MSQLSLVSSVRSRSGEFTTTEDQKMLLGQALQTIKVQASLMKKCLNGDNLMDAFKHGDLLSDHSIFHAHRATHLRTRSKRLLRAVYGHF
jgi:hypothetical protein